MRSSSSASAVDRFRQEGFALIEQLADQGTVDDFREVYDGMLSGAIACPNTDRQLGGLTRQIMLPHLHHPVFADNTALSKAKELARDLVECEDPQFYFSMLIYKPPGHPHATPWHQDMSYAGRPATKPGTQWPGNAIAQFWLALDDVDETMGCMEFVPGAHLKPMPEHYVASGEPDDDGRLLAMVDPESQLDLSKAVKCPLSAGSATVHSYATPHFTGPNQSQTRGRRAYIFSFANKEVLTNLHRQLPA
jgi:hypothetical protein